LVEIERQRQEKSAKNKASLQKIIEDMWNNLGAEVCQKLVDSMPQSFIAVIKAKGSHMKY
jgi:chaperonin GroEL (HSP60 family)